MRCWRRIPIPARGWEGSVCADKVIRRDGLVVASVYQSDSSGTSATGGLGETRMWLDGEGGLSQFGGVDVGRWATTDADTADRADELIRCLLRRPNARASRSLMAWSEAGAPQQADECNAWLCSKTAGSVRTGHRWNEGLVAAKQGPSVPCSLPHGSSVSYRSHLMMVVCAHRVGCVHEGMDRCHGVRHKAPTDVYQPCLSVGRSASRSVCLPACAVCSTACYPLPTNCRPALTHHH
jgi:hypothetical protein